MIFYTFFDKFEYSNNRKASLLLNLNSLSKIRPIFQYISYRKKLFDNYFNETIVFHIQWEKDKNDFTIIFLIFQRKMQSIGTGHYGQHLDIEERHPFPQ